MDATALEARGEQAAAAREALTLRASQRRGPHIDRRTPTVGRALQARTNHNKATCALANKLARIAWAVWMKHEKYRASEAGATAAS